MPLGITEFLDSGESSRSPFFITSGTGKYLDSDWMENIDNPEIWDNIINIPDEELWAVRRHLKRKLVFYMRERARGQWIQDKIHPDACACIQHAQNGEVLCAGYVLSTDG